MDDAVNTREPSHWVYVLELVNEMYYVGSTKDVSRRLSEHHEGVGSEWTAKYPPLELRKSIPCHTLGEALLIEDAVTLWTMVYTKYPSCVRGGRWMKEGHEHIYGLSEARKVIQDKNLSKIEIRDALIAIVKWTIPDHSWYWDNLFASYPKMKKNRVFNDLGVMPEIVKRHHRSR